MQSALVSLEQVAPMQQRIRALWTRLRELEPGQRFETFHREQKSEYRAVKVAFFAAGFVCLAAGAVFALIPGPAILFFGLGGALLAAQSLWIARWLDRGELWTRGALARLRGEGQYRS